MKQRFSMARMRLTSEMIARREELEVLLQKNGETVRDDSRLAYQYMCNGGDASLVAHELLCVNFLYQHTNYDAHCQTGLKQIAELAHQTYPNLPWKVIWSVVREYGVPAMKCFALAEARTFPPAYDVTPCTPSTAPPPASCTMDTA